MRSVCFRFLLDLLNVVASASLGALSALTPLLLFHVVLAHQFLPTYHTFFHLIYIKFSLNKPNIHFMCLLRTVLPQFMETTCPSYCCNCEQKLLVRL